MNVEIKLVGEINDAKMQNVLNVLTSNNQVAASKAVAPAAAKAVKAETAAQTEEEETETTAKAAPKAAAKPAAAKAPAAKAAKPAAAVTEDPQEALDAMEDADEQLAYIQAEVTKLSKKGKTADIKKLLALFDSPKVSELDPATYSEFFSLVLRFKGGETSDEIVESYEV